MTPAELLNMLQTLPKEAMNTPIIVQAQSPLYTHAADINVVYCVLQNQYMSKHDSSLINQDTYDNLQDIEPNDFCQVKRDYELAYPRHTLFILSEVEQMKEEIKPEPPSKGDLIRGAIAEGNIPHLRVEKE